MSYLPEIGHLAAWMAIFCAVAGGAGAGYGLWLKHKRSDRLRDNADHVRHLLRDRKLSDEAAREIRLILEDSSSDAAASH